MKNKTGTAAATSAAVLVSMALTLGMAPASQAAPLAPAVTTSVSTAQTSLASTAPASIAASKAVVAPTVVPVTGMVAQSAQSDPWASQTLSLINEQRRIRGLAPLAWNQQIADVAQGWAAHLGEATKSPSFSWANIHRPDAGGSLIPRGATWYREVVVFEFSPAKAVTWWMNSPGHRDAIMSPNATHIGIGHVTPGSGPYAGWNQMVANLGSYPTPPAGSAAPAPAPAPTQDKVIGTAKAIFEVNFRTGPGTNYPAYRTVPQGGTVNVLGASVNGWTKVSFDGKTGYVSTSYLTATATAPAPAPAPAADTVIGTAKTTFNVNFRAGATTGSGILGVVPQGTTVNLLSASVNGWTKVSWNGKTGYISTSYLTAAGAVASPTPVADTVIGTAKAIYAVNFRAGAGTHTSSLMVVPQGATVNVLSASVNGWTKVSYAGKTGYISTPYLSSNSATARTTYNVNFRVGPSTGTGIIMVVPQGATVNVVEGSVNGWTKVTYAGKTGYISTDYLVR